MPRTPALQFTVVDSRKKAVFLSSFSVTKVLLKPSSQVQGITVAVPAGEKQHHTLNYSTAST